MDRKKLIIDEMTSIKPKCKDVGTCLRQKGEVQIYRSKFKNSKDAQDQLDMLNRLGVINPTYKVYKCPACTLWHFGLKEWADE